MNTEQSYLQLIKELKQNIIQSRYEASRLANRELLKLYYTWKNRSKLTTYSGVNWPPSPVETDHLIPEQIDQGKPEQTDHPRR